MRASYGIFVVFVVFILSLNSQVALAKENLKAELQVNQNRPLSLYLTHGVSDLNSKELERLGVAASAFAVGAGAGFALTNELALSTELLFIDSYRRVPTDYSHPTNSPASVRYHQDRLTVGVTWKRQVAKNLILFPEAGVSANRLKLTLSEKKYRKIAAQKSYGGFAGVGVIIPIKRVFFDIRYKYQETKLNMEDFGLDKIMYQSTTLAGFGFVL